MKNQERWDFVQKYSSKELMRTGVIMLLASLLGLIFNFNEDLELIIGLIIMIALIVVLFFRVERVIKLRFTE